MKRKKKNQIPNINIEDTESNESEELKTEKKKKRFGRKKQNDQIVRIEELEKMMEKYGDDVDPEDIVSMYIPHRRSKYGIGGWEDSKGRGRRGSEGSDSGDS